MDNHPQTAVLVDFSQYSGPPFLLERPKCIPIASITFEWDSKSRQQIPLQLRYAITIHKSQGQTLGKTVIDIGKSEMSSGCTFVALSRLKRLKDGILQPMSFERLQYWQGQKNGRKDSWRKKVTTIIWCNNELYGCCSVMFLKSCMWVHHQINSRLTMTIIYEVTKKIIHITCVQ